MTELWPSLTSQGPRASQAPASLKDKRGQKWREQHTQLSKTGKPRSSRNRTRSAQLHKPSTEDSWLEYGTVSSLILTQLLKQGSQKGNAILAMACDSIILTKGPCLGYLPGHHCHITTDGLFLAHFPAKSLERFAMGHSQDIHSKWFHRSSYSEWGRRRGRRKIVCGGDGE